MNEKDTPISSENKAIARHVASVFGGKPAVDEYADEPETLKVGILFCRDRPREGVTSYSTIKLSDYPMKWGDEEFPTRIELAGLCSNAARFFPNILASAAFCIMRSEAVYHPGTVMPNYVRRSYPSSKLPHLYLTTPFLWEHELQMVDFETKKVSWLLAFPIAESEYAYLQTRDAKTFEKLLEDRHIDISDLDRLPVA